MSDTKQKEDKTQEAKKAPTRKWSESFETAPRNVKVKGKYFVLGRESMKLKNGTEIFAPSTDDEWKEIERMFPQALKSKK